MRLVTLALGVAAVLGVGVWPRTAWGAQELFVANYSANSITVYSLSAGGNTAAGRTIVGGFTGLNAPFGIAVDTLNNELVVANFSSITVYNRGANGNEAPLRTISGPDTGLNGPTGVIVDTARDELLVTNSDYPVTNNNNSVTDRSASRSTPCTTSSRSRTSNP